MTRRVRSSPRMEPLPRGEFFGRFEARREVAGMALARLMATVPEREVERHAHVDAHFVLVLEGLYLSSAAGAPEVALAPFLVYNPPGTEHRDRFRSERGRFFTLSLGPAVCADTAAGARLPARPCALGPRALALARRLERENSRGEDALNVEALACELLGEVVERGGAGQRSRALPGARGAPPWLLSVRDRLRDEAAEPLAISALAAAAGVHPVHLARAFRRHFHMAPGDYLRLCRAERAVTLLAEGRLSLTEIALACGFADQSHFTRAFRRARGMSPAAFRRGI